MLDFTDGDNVSLNVSTAQPEAASTNEGGPIDDVAGDNPGCVARPSFDGAMPSRGKPMESPVDA